MKYEKKIHFEPTNPHKFPANIAEKLADLQMTENTARRRCLNPATALAFAISLELSLAETEDMLRKAGCCERGGVR